MTPLLRAAQAGALGRLRADEPVLDAQAIVRERLLEEQMAELLVERVVAVVSDRRAGRRATRNVSA